MEVERQRLALFIMSDLKLASGLTRTGFAGFLLALGPFLGLFRLFFLAGAFTRAFVLGRT